MKKAEIKLLVFQQLSVNWERSSGGLPGTLSAVKVTRIILKRILRDFESE